MSTDAGPIPSVIGDHRIEGVLGRGGMGVVYRAVHGETGDAIALKTVLLPQKDLLQRIRREIHALARVRHPGVVRIVDEGLDNGLPWYAMELLDGVGLREHAGVERSVAETPGVATARAGERGAADRTATPSSRGWWTRSIARSPGDPADPGDRPPPPSADGPRELSADLLIRILTTVRRLCAPLAFLHGEGIVHRDLKPGNVIVCPGDRPVLVDFGLMAEFGASVGRETATVEREMAGTPYYMAPEQITGAFVDARADLYALGCVLYELLTGRPPFVGDTAMQTVCAHLSDAPRPPSALADGIPRELDALVLRLLAKEPAERIGYAEDVAATLGQLGGHDGQPAGAPKPRVYLYRPGFAGREAAVERLERSVDDAGNGGALALVGGESGVGKTRLMLEIARRAVERDTRVLVGEGLSGAMRPLEPLRKPLQALADRCREEGLAETERVLGRRGRLLAQYEPALAGLPGQASYPAPPELEPDAARELLFTSLAETFAALATDRPSLVIVDDLQWGDDLTLGFLHALAIGAVDAGGTRFVGTYRSEEVTDGLRRLLDAAADRQLDLTRLDERGVGAIVGDMLALTKPPGRLVRFVTRQSEGNPFFVGEYLRTAAQEGLLFRDGDGRWQVVQRDGADRGDDEFSALPLPGSLRDLVSRRLGALSDGAQRLLEIAAVVGREAPLELLQQVSALDDEALDDAFAELLRRHVAEEPRPGVFRFLHDKLREGPYTTQPADQLRARHQRVAEVLDAHPRDGSEYVYALAHHFGRGEVDKDPARVQQTCAAAGLRAVADNAPEEAYAFFARGDEVARHAGRAPEPAVEAAWGEACARLDRVSEALEHLQQALARTDEPAARSHLRARLATVHLATWDSRSAWDECTRALVELGQPFPRSRVRQLVTSTWAWLRGIAAGRLRRLYGSARGAQRARQQALARLYQTAMVVSYFEMDAINFVQLAMRALRPAHLLGPSPELVDTYSSYATVLGTLQLARSGDRHAARAVALADELEDVRLQSSARFWQAVTVSFSGRARQAVGAMRAVLADHGRWLDTADYINGCADVTWNLVIRGYAREAWEAQQLLRRKTRETSGTAGAMEGHPAHSQQLVVLSLLGRADEALPYLGLARELVDKHPTDRFRIAFLNSTALMLLLEQGELGEPAEDTIRAFTRVSPAPELTLVHLRWFYVFQGYLRLAQCVGADGAARRERLGALRRALRDLRRAANVGVLRAHRRVIEAAFARLRGRPGAARRRLEAAAREAHTVDSPWVLFEVARQRALLARDAGDADAVAAAAAEALRLADEHGWRARSRGVAAEFGLDGDGD